MNAIFALVMLVTINGDSNVYVIDHGLTHDDCVSELGNADLSDWRPADTTSTVEIRLTCQTR